MPASAAARRVERTLLRLALSYPEAREDFPWGERVLKVRGKIFLFLSADAEGLHVTVKLPETGAFALMLPDVAPTGYNLGKSGWVSAKFERPAEVSAKMLSQWIDESYRAVAPTRLVRGLAGRTDASPKRSLRRRRGR